MMTSMVRAFLAILVLSVVGAGADAAPPAVWQWSVPAGKFRAFLWIPETCRKVRGAIVAQHNMSEEGVLEHPVIRGQLAQSNFAAVWIVPPNDPVFDFTHGAGEVLETILASLGVESGYEELARVPLIPLGHSACASFPWNFGAWRPERTLAMISLHGDAPRTNMTGSGRPNPPWGERNIDGIPGLMMMAEYEWLEGRLQPAIAFQKAHPRATLAMLAEPGTGHFDVSDDALRFVALFIRKAVEYRMPSDSSAGLRKLRAEDGWLLQRWRLDQKRAVPPAPYADYRGDRAEAFWAFDQETAEHTHRFRENQIGKKPQLLGFVERGAVVPQTNTHYQVALAFQPEDDGITFRLTPTFLDRVDPGSSNTSRWTGLPPSSPIGHARGGGPIRLSRITGPVVQVDETRFRVELNRAFTEVDRRARDIWLLASHEGDEVCKSARQQALLTLPMNREGRPQQLTFPALPDRPLSDLRPYRLNATSDADVPVHYYVREGPAYLVNGDVLHFTPLPPRARVPVKITVVAWQLGRGAEPKLKEARPVERSFQLVVEPPLR